MGKRGPKKGQGGRPKTKTDVISKILRLRMRKSRALKYGHLEKAQQIQKEIESLTVELKKQKIIDIDSEVFSTTIYYAGYSLSEKKDEQSKKSN